MAVSIESQSFHDADLVIDERIVEIEDDDAEVWFESRLSDTNAMILVQFLSGEPELMADIPLPEVGERRPVGALFMGAMDAGARSFIRLTARGTAKVRVIFAQIRRQLVAAGRALPCRFCKMAVKTIVSAVLLHLGIPALPSGDFDLGNFAAALQNAGADIAAGNFGEVVRQLASLLPGNIWDMILQALSALNWIFDLGGKLNEWTCRQIGMCP